jgi:hypothetical protein
VSALSPILRSLAGGGVAFWCPGCDEAHNVTPGIWAWDGNVERPTFSPSVLVRSGHYIDGKKPCWCTYNAEHPDDPAVFTCSVCHSFVRDGRIEFLSDCTHRLAGQTVPLPPWPEEPKA